MVLVGSNSPSRSTSRTTAVPVSVLSNSVGRPRSIVQSRTRQPSSVSIRRPGGVGGHGWRVERDRQRPDRVSHDGRTSAAPSASPTGSAPWWWPGRSRGRRSDTDVDRLELQPGDVAGQRAAARPAQAGAGGKDRRPASSSTPASARPTGRCRRPCRTRHGQSRRTPVIASRVSGVISSRNNRATPANRSVSFFGKSLSAAAPSGVCSNCFGQVRAGRDRRPPGSELPVASRCCLAASACSRPRGFRCGVSLPRRLRPAVRGLVARRWRRSPPRCS